MMSLPEGDAVFKITSAPGKTSREAGLSLREDHVGQVIDPKAGSRSPHPPVREPMKSASWAGV